MTDHLLTLVHACWIADVVGAAGPGRSLPVGEGMPSVGAPEAERLALDERKTWQAPETAPGL
jgi:hypothetical protein